MDKAVSQSAASTLVDWIGKLLTIGVSVAAIIEVVCTIAAGPVQVVVNPDPSATVAPAPSVTYRPLEDFENDDVRLAYAADLIGQGQHQAAAAFLSDFLAMVEPGSQLATAIQYDRGLAHLYLKEYNQAVVDLSTVTAQVEYSDAYYNLGNAYTGLEDDENALAAYEHAIALEQKPEYVAARDAALARLNLESA